MAKILADTFQGDPRAGELLKKVRAAMKTLCVAATGKDEYISVPMNLLDVRGSLNGAWQTIWRKLTITYSPQEKGASIDPHYKVSIGPFFLNTRFDSVDMEKIILHEYLHHAMTFQARGQGGAELEHSAIDTLLSQMGYKEPLNPGKGKVH